MRWPIGGGGAEGVEGGRSPCLLSLLSSDSIEVESRQCLSGRGYAMAIREEFLDNARCLISEAYCRIHQRIDIGYAWVMVSTI